MVIIFALASALLFDRARDANHQAATAVVAQEQAVAAQGTSAAQVATATVEQGKAQNAAITATIAQGAALAQADLAQQDAQNARTEVAVAGVTLTSVPPILTAVASAWLMREWNNALASGWQMPC